MSILSVLLMASVNHEELTVKLNTLLKPVTNKPTPTVNADRLVANYICKLQPHQHCITSL